MKEFKAHIGLDADNKITFIEPCKPGGQVTDICIQTVRVYTQAEIDREYAECMQEGVHTYHREKGRIRQDR